MIPESAIPGNLVIINFANPTAHRLTPRYVYGLNDEHGCWTAFAGSCFGIARRKFPAIVVARFKPKDEEYDDPTDNLYVQFTDVDQVIAIVFVDHMKHGSKVFLIADLERFAKIEEMDA